ncbi:Sulfate permease family protein [uncultured archaeon]|nr:Sulfate permease family protein [uncultured archaeon]
MRLKKYLKEAFTFDLKAGFITAIVALPLAIGFAIASGVEPVLGIYTAIIAGILGSSFGGSKYSITGPTGAMAVIILATLTKFGLEGLLLAGFLAGLIQILFGAIKLGKLVKYIPLPVITGFTAGIGVLIFLGQIGNFFGMSIPSQEHIWGTLFYIIKSISSINLIAIAISIGTIALLIFYPIISNKINFLKNIPSSIIALIFSGFAVFLFSLSVPIIGIIPITFPEIHLLNFNFKIVLDVLPFAFTIALLGCLESLLCAVVCDAMTNTKHNSNKELIGQGIANVILPFFVAIPSTAAIARSAVNIREGAKTRMAGIFHAIIILIIVFFLSPFAKYVPKSFLAGVLMVVSIKMINFEEIKSILNTGKSEFLVFMITFSLTVLTDLVFAVQIGMFLAVLLVFYRLTQITNIKYMEEYDSRGEINSIINSDHSLKSKVSVYTIHGPFFFGAINVFEQKIKEHLDMRLPYVIIRMKHVPFIDGTGAIQLINFLRTRKKHGGKVYFTEFWPGVKEKLFKNKEIRELVKKEDIFNSVAQALKEIKKNII